MLILIIKFLHLLCAISLIGLLFFCLAAPQKIILSQLFFLKSIQKSFILMSLIAAITGTLLIYPKHYTFHTHWIQAAYFLLLIAILWIYFYLKRIRSHKQWLIFCMGLFFILITIVHDAVTKQTFF